MDKNRIGGGPIFLCSAIRVKDSENKFKIFTGLRHHMIFEKIVRDGLWENYLEWSEQGFMIDNGNGEKFVNRQEATEIAKIWNIPMIGSVLTSEDLW